MSLHVSRLFLSVTALKRRTAGIFDAPADLLLTEDARLFATEQNPNLFVAVEQLLITTLITQDFKRLSTEQDPNLFIETEQYVVPSS
jgi:hypothetical protein